MSSGQKPRTPEYFPRMKHRARRRDRVRRELLAHFLAVGQAGPSLSDLGQAFESALREVARPIAERVQAAFEAFIFPRPHRSDYALTPEREDDQA